MLDFCGLDRILVQGCEGIGGRMEHSDEHLLELALQGDGACFGELSRRWQFKIYGFIYRYVGTSEEAQDLTQNTFTKAFQNLDRLSDPSRFSSWLYKIALNECRMRFRSQRNFVSVPLAEQAPERPERGVRNPEEALLAKETSHLLQEAFARLPEEQKTVILMKEYQDLKFHEISEILEVPLSTVKSRMYLGLKTLRRLMEERL